MSSDATSATGDLRGLLRYATSPGSSSFADFAAAVAPDVLPGRVTDAGSVAHGTTIVAAMYDGGVVMAGDRRATAGNLIAQRDIQKVYAADDHSLVGIAGTAGLAIELVRLYQVELEHYEKIEGTPLTIEGKANRLATMIRGNLGMAMQGLAVVPMFAGYDVDEPEAARGGRIYSFDVTGSRNAERYYHSVGSGSLFARGALKKLWHEGLDRAGVIRVVVESLYDAADDDSATGGPDLTRGIYPVIMTATAEGTARVPDDEIAGVVRVLLAEREATPGA